MYADISEISSWNVSMLECAQYLVKFEFVDEVQLQYPLNISF